MGITRLKRKARKNKQRSAARINTIKQLTATPVIANIDKEALKASFEAEKKEAKPAKEAKPVAKKEEKPVTEAKPKAKKVKAELKAEKKTEE